MCDNSLLADQFRMRLAEATQQVDEALENVRSLKTAILATVAVKDSAAGLPNDGEIYLEQYEYVQLLMAKKAIQRVRELHKRAVGGGLSVCDECRFMYPCPTIKALDGEQ